MKKKRLYFFVFILFVVCLSLSYIYAKCERYFSFTVYRWLNWVLDSRRLGLGSFGRFVIQELLFVGCDKGDGGGKGKYKSDQGYGDKETENFRTPKIKKGPTSEREKERKTLNSKHRRVSMSLSRRFESGKFIGTGNGRTVRCVADGVAWVQQKKEKG